MRPDREALGYLSESKVAMTFLKRAVKDGRKFLNPVPTAVGGFSVALKVLPEYFGNRKEAEPKVAVGPFPVDLGVFGTPPESGLRVTWLGHSQMILEIDGLRVLIDPVWEERASPFSFFGPKRFFAPPLALEDLPQVDVVLVSHDHYDHMGAGTIRRLATLNATAKAVWVTSLGVAKRLRKLGVPAARISELDWTQSVEVAGPKLAAGLTITSVPSRHFSGRGLLDRFTTLWASFVIAGPKHRVYFGADSGMWEGFAEIGEAYGPFDLTMLEVGAFHPLWKGIHMGPDGAFEAYAALGGAARAGMLFPIHWGLFNLALHGWREPMERVTERAEAEGVLLWSPRPGVPTEVVDGVAVLDEWWRSRK